MIIEVSSTLPEVCDRLASHERHPQLVATLPVLEIWLPAHVCKQFPSVYLVKAETAPPLGSSCKMTSCFAKLVAKIQESQISNSVNLEQWTRSHYLVELCEFRGSQVRENSFEPYLSYFPKSQICEVFHLRSNADESWDFLGRLGDV